MADQTIKPKKVSVRYTKTIQKLRRDFRWFVLANENTGYNNTCQPPFFPLSLADMEKRESHGLKWPAGQMCIQPIYWSQDDLEEVSPGVYHTPPPSYDHDGYWYGYYIEVQFDGSHYDKIHRYQKYSPNFRPGGSDSD